MGPVSAQTRMTTTAIPNAIELPAHSVTRTENASRNRASGELFGDAFWRADVGRRRFTTISLSRRRRASAHGTGFLPADRSEKSGATRMPCVESGPRLAHAVSWR